MDAWIAAILIGIVEGITEFLPISSTAHIILTQQLLGFQDRHEVFAVTIQLGAILAVCAYYWKRLAGVATTVHKDPTSQRFAMGVIIAFMPPAILGFLFNDWLEENVFRADMVLAVIAVTMFLGGLLILWIESRQHKAVHRDAGNLPWKTALGVGFLQVLAMIPGVSRSGASIMGGMLIGLERKAATEFSFFLAIPIMLGASVLKLAKHWHVLDGEFLWIVTIGFVVSFVSALIVIHWLLRYVSQHTFKPFGWYRIVMGIFLGVLAFGGFV
jgi:undecaprenyl-diphosphatase